MGWRTGDYMQNRKIIKGVLNNLFDNLKRLDSIYLGTSVSRDLYSAVVWCNILLDHNSCHYNELTAFSEF